MAVDKILQEERNIPHLLIAASPDFVSDVGRDVLGPPLGGIETDDSDRALVLAAQEVGDHGVKIGVFRVGFRPNPAGAAKVVEDHVDVLIVIARHD